MWFAPPKEIPTRVLTRMPDQFRRLERPRGELHRPAVDLGLDGDGLELLELERVAEEHLHGEAHVVQVVERVVEARADAGDDGQDGVPRAQIGRDLKVDPLGHDAA